MLAGSGGIDAWDDTADKEAVPRATSWILVLKLLLEDSCGWGDNGDGGRMVRSAVRCAAGGAAVDACRSNRVVENPVR